MKKYITYEEYLNRVENIKQLESQGFKFIYKKNKFKIICGVGCLIIAVFPNGLGLIFYPLGFILLGLSSVDLFRYKEIVLRKIKNKLRGF